MPSNRAAFHGPPVPPVIALLRARRSAGGRRPFGDDARIALCVEGGAMRGVISAGMVAALQELGYADAFDAVYGSSAGAINAAYFLAHQAELGTTIYYDDINTREFIDFRRALSGRPIVDLDFLLDDVAHHRKPLDAGRVLRSPTPLRVIATDVETARAEVLSGFADAGALMSALRASATMPILAGGPFTRAGRQYFDASLSEPIPVPQAESDGYTHIMVFLTRPADERPGDGAFDRYFVAPRLRRVSPVLADRFVSRGEPYAELNRALDTGWGPHGRAQTVALRPMLPAISKLERRREVLEAGAAEGRRVVVEALGQ
jgi:predicted patatin/cPLA2 family phospholipase